MVRDHHCSHGSRCSWTKFYSISSDYRVVLVVVVVVCAFVSVFEQYVVSVFFYSPGSQQSGVSPGWGSVSHLSPGELGASQPTKRPGAGLQTAVDREPVWQGTGLHHHCHSTACQKSSLYVEFNKPLNIIYVTNHSTFCQSNSRNKHYTHTAGFNIISTDVMLLSEMLYFWPSACKCREWNPQVFVTLIEWSVITPLCLCSECGGERTQLQDGRPQ